MTASDNPLIEFGGLTRFDRIVPAHVTPAVDTLIAQARETIERVAASTEPPTWRTSPSRSPPRSTASTARGARCAT